ncbi:MAG TPA: thioesterase family protein [Steroidobacteraceae bacterium]|nr:thioesterase family protein [Steroidobacteraceae bacterium]
MANALYELTLETGWSDMDMNGHMANTAYLEKAVDVRLRFFAAHHFGIGEFARLRVGPVVMSDELGYFREVHLQEPLRATLALAGLADDGSRWRMQNEFYRADGQLAARVTSAGGWLDLETRRLIAPPPPMAAALATLARTADFAVLPSSLRAR